MTLFFVYYFSFKICVDAISMQLENTPCIIADEIMIIGFDGIAYPCDSIKYFTKAKI